MTFQFDNGHIALVAELSGEGGLHIEGSVKEPKRFRRMELLAAAPIDRRTSHAGSGLPWPCPDIAFEGTPNHITIPADGLFRAEFQYPNTYYTHDAVTKVRPTVFARLFAKDSPEPMVIRMELPDPLVLRTLTHRSARRGPEFYSKKEEVVDVATAEKTMYALGEAKETQGLA